MADISQTLRSLEALRGVLNRERVEEVREGQGMRAAFRNAEAALAAYDKAKSELKFADAGPLSEAAATAVEGAWTHYRRLEAEWAFDQVAKLETSLTSLANGKRHPHFGVRRFFHDVLRRSFQAAQDKLGFIKSWKPELGKSDVLRGHVREAWDAADGAWDIHAAIEKAGGLPGSWLFRSPILGVLNAEAVRRAKLANEAAKAQTPEGQKPLAVKPTVYGWESIVRDEINFQLALPEGEQAAATRDRLTAQRALAIKLDAKGLKVEALYSAYKTGKLVPAATGNGVNGLTEAEIELIKARFEAMEAPKVPKGTPAPKPAAEAPAPAIAPAPVVGHPDPAALQAAADGGDSIAQALVNLADRENGKDEPPAVDETLSLDHPGFHGFVVAEAEKAGQPAEKVLANLAADPAAMASARAAYAKSLDGAGDEPKAKSPKRKLKADGHSAAAEKNGKPAPRARRTREAAAAVEED